MPGDPPQRTRLTVQQKIEIAKYIRNGINYETFAIQYNFSLQTLIRIKEFHRNLKSKVNKRSIWSDKNTLLRAQIDVIDEHLIQFVQICLQATLVSS